MELWTKSSALSAKDFGFDRERNIPMNRPASDHVTMWRDSTKLECRTDTRSE